MKRLILAALVVSSIISCKKNDNGNSCTTSKATLTGIYKITAKTYKASASATVVDEFATLAACEKDDTYEFKASGDFVFTDAGVTCGGPVVPGGLTWALSADSKQIIISSVASTATTKIVSFDCKNLVVSEADVNISGDIETTTYVKQ